MSKPPTTEDRRSALRWIVDPEDAGTRLDVYLADRAGVARNRIQHWIVDGFVLVEGAAVRPSRRLVEGESIVLDPPEPSPSPLIPVAVALDILWQDDWFTAIDKPAGLVVHPGAGKEEDSVVQRALFADPGVAEVGSSKRPGIVHRLDAGTSGVMVLARTQAAYDALSRKFEKRTVEKRYLAIVWGHPVESGRVSEPIGRHPHNRKQMTVRTDGRRAVSSWRVADRCEWTSLLSVEIETGRTHQIRVHLKHAGYPIVGDATYGENRWKNLPGGTRRNRLRDFARPALHAAELRFVHPGTGEELTIESSPPRDMVALWEELGGDPAALQDAGGDRGRRPG